MRNPHGAEQENYKGGWGDDDSRWTPEVIAWVAAADTTDEFEMSNDGSFFMEWSHYYSRFQVTLFNYSTE